MDEFYYLMLAFAPMYMLFAPLVLALMYHSLSKYSKWTMHLGAWTVAILWPIVLVVCLICAYVYFVFSTIYRSWR